MMKIFPLVLIQIYWRVVPKHKRGKCLFKESCSQFVYRRIKNEGIVSGAEAMIYRIKVCNRYAEIFTNPATGELNTLLSNGDILCQEEMAIRINKIP